MDKQPVQRFVTGIFMGGAGIIFGTSATDWQEPWMRDSVAVVALILLIGGMSIMLWESYAARK